MLLKTFVHVCIYISHVYISKAICNNFSMKLKTWWPRQGHPLNFMYIWIYIYFYLFTFIECTLNDHLHNGCMYGAHLLILEMSFFLPVAAYNSIFIFQIILSFSLCRLLWVKKILSTVTFTYVVRYNSCKKIDLDSGRKGKVNQKLPFSVPESWWG